MFFKVLEIPISYENSAENDGSPECEFIPKTLPKQNDSTDSEKKVSSPGWSKICTFSYQLCFSDLFLHKFPV